MDLLFCLLLLALLIVALEPEHRRTFGLPRAPFGADARPDHDLDRVLHDLRR